MNSRQSPSPQLGKSTYSSGARRDVLWNVVQPGDPYDIRKSMIAKLPSDKQHFMGDNLEIVCLLQSAQIQRLCQFLDDYKFRYREIERRQLDRHSYQIQIKQLTQRLLDEGTFKSQNSKLKDFIKKQTLQIQQLKNNRHHVDNNLRANYESALVQIQTLINENNYFKSQKQNFILQINNYSIRIEALESARERQMKELYNKFAEQNKFALQNETKSVRLRYQSQLSRLQFQIKRLKQFNEAKNEQINQLSLKNRNLLVQIDEMSKIKNRPDPSFSNQMEERFALMGQQIQRLNLRIRQSTAKIDQSSRNQLYWKDKHNRIQEDYKQLQSRYREISEQYKTIKIQFDKIQTSQVSGGSQPIQSSKYEDQIRQLNLEIRRLQQQKASQTQKYTILYKQFSELQYNYTKISVIQRQNVEMKNNQANTQQLRRKIAEYQTKVALLSQQIQRLTSMTKTSNLDRMGFDQLKTDFEDFKRKSLEKQRNITQKYESEMQRKVLQYESKLAKFASQSGNQFQVRLQAINRQVQRLNQYLKQKTQQSQFNKKKIREMQNLINQKYEVQTNRQYSSYQITIKQLKTQNDQLSRKFKDFDNINRKIAEYENKLVLLTQQIERLNFQLKLKTDQLENVRRFAQKDQQPSSNIQDIQTSRKISIYEETQFKLTRQNQDLRRRLQQIVELNRKVKQYQDRIRAITQQNQRINQNLRQKIQLLNRAQINIRNITQEIQVLRKNKYQIQSSYSQKFQLDKMQTSRKFSNYQQSLSSIQRQYDQLRRRMMDMGNDSNRKVNQYQNKIVLLTQQLQRLNQTFKLKINQYQGVIQGQRNQLQLSRRQNKQLQINITQKYELETSRKIGMFEQNMSGLNRELQDHRRRINQYENALRKKNEQVSQLENRYRVVSQQYESFKFQVKNFEGEVTRSQSSYQQNMTRITRQYEDLKRKIPQYQNRIALMSQQIERLNTVIRNGQQEQENLRRNINELKVQITNKYQIETSRKISGYQQNLSLINRQKEDLRRKITQYQTKITNLTREIEDRNRKLIEWQNKFRQSVQETQILNNKFRQLQMTVTQKYQVQTTRKITTYQQNIQNLGRQLEAARLKINEYQNLRINYQKQINRLNGVLKNNSEQHERLIIRIRQMQTSITQKYQVQVTRQFQVYEQNISNLNVQIEDFRRKLMNSQQVSKNQANQLQELRRRLKQFGDVHRNILQYESKFNSVRQQLERVNLNLKNKVDQCIMLENKLRQFMQESEQLRRRIKQNEISFNNKYQMQINQKTTVFQQNITNFKRENDQIRRALSQYENKIALMNQQIQRLNNVLKSKVQQLNQSEQRNRNWQQQIQNLKRKMVELQKFSNQRLDTEMSRTVSLYQQNITTITREYDQFKRNAARINAQLETKVALLSQQLQRSAQALRQRTQDLSQSDMKLKNAIVQIQRLQRTFKQFEITTSKRIETQKSTIVSTYEQNFSGISRQFQDYKLQSNRKLSESQNRIMQITRQLERVNGNLAKKVEDCNNLERRIMQFTQQIETLRRQIKQNQLSFNQKYQVEISRKVSAYEQNFTTMKNELESLDRKNKEYAKRIAQDQNRIALMTQQIQRLNLVLKTKTDEAKHYQGQVQKYIAQLQNLKTNISGYYTIQIQKLNAIIKQRTQQYQLLQQKFSQLQSGQNTEFKQLQSSHSLITKQYQNSKRHLAEYQQSIRKLYSQFQRLQVIINQLKVERQTLFEKNHGLIKQIQRLTAQNKDQETQLYEIRLKLSDQVALQKRINEHMALMVVLFAQIQTLRQRVKDKQKQVQQVRRSSLAPLKA